MLLRTPRAGPTISSLRHWLRNTRELVLNLILSVCSFCPEFWALPTMRPAIQARSCCPITPPCTSNLQQRHLCRTSYKEIFMLLHHACSALLRLSRHPALMPLA
jgi:hypothetical protein